MPSSSTSNTANEQCEHCHSSYSLIRKRKLCVVCRQYYCSSCAPRDRSDNHSYRICLTCQSIANSTITQEQLLELKVKHLRNYLEAKNIRHNTCKEKRELVDLVLNNRNIPFSRTVLQQVQSSPQSNNRSEEQNSNASTTRSNKSGPFSNLQQTVSSFANQVNSFASNIQDMVSNTVSDVVNFTVSDEPTQSTSNTNNPNRGASPNIPPNSQTRNPPPTATNRPPTYNPQPPRPPTFNPQPPRPPTFNPQPPHSRPSTASASSTSTTAQRPRRKSLSEINHEDNIEDLNVRELKELLATNFVDYKGCIERSELIEKVRRLYRDRQNEKIKAAELNNTAACDSELCKICMDAIVDCVFLDCGHMVTCVKCGKLLAECPICRSNIVRVVRVFKS